MDIPAIYHRIPLEDREEVRRAIAVLASSRVFESMLDQCKQEILEAAMVLAHSREYAQVERVAIRAGIIAELVDGFKNVIAI